MKKLSEILSEHRITEEQTPSLHHTPSLVLFGDVLDKEKIIRSPELAKLAGFMFGDSTLSVVQVEDSEKLHDWFREEQYKIDAQGRAMIYPVKAKFEDLTSDTHSEEFSGPLYVQVLFTEDTALDILTITCKWFDGLFRNDYYVVGVIVDSKDLERIRKDI